MKQTLSRFDLWIQQSAYQKLWSYALEDQGICARKLERVELGILDVCVTDSRCYKMQSSLRQPVRDTEMNDQDG